MHARTHDSAASCRPFAKAPRQSLWSCPPDFESFSATPGADLLVEYKRRKRTNGILVIYFEETEK